MSKYLRDKYGLNQQQIAEWLGVSRGHVAHYERHTRKLPKDASAKHSQMLILMAKMETAAAKNGSSRKTVPDTMLRLDKVREDVDYEKSGARLKANKMKKDFLAMQKRYSQTRDLVELLKMLMKVGIKGKSKAETLWLEVQYHEAESRLEKCDEMAQLEMRWKIAKLEAIAGAAL